MPFFTLSFQIACEREQSQTGYNFHHEYGVALFPPTPILICPTPCLDSTPPPSSTVAVCSKYHHHQILSEDSPIYSPSRWWPWQCFVRTGTWLVLFQQEFWPSCESPNILVGGYFRHGVESGTLVEIVDDLPAPVSKFLLAVWVDRVAGYPDTQ